MLFTELVYCCGVFLQQGSPTNMILDATPKSKWIGEPDYDFAVKDKDAGASFFQSDTDARRESV